MVIYVFEGVSMPIVMNVVRDKWCPNCGTMEDDGDAALNPLSNEDEDGLKSIMLLTVLGMVWAVILWGLAVQRRRRKGGFVCTALSKDLMVDSIHGT